MKGGRHCHALSPSELKHRLDILAEERRLERNLIGMKLIDEVQDPVKDLFEFQFVAGILCKMDHAQLKQLELSALNHHDSVAHDVGSGIKAQDDLFFDRFFLHFARRSKVTPYQMSAYYAVVFALYFLTLLVLLAGWHRRRFSPKRGGVLRRISVIVPVRNEASNIETLLDDLARIDYPAEYFEVLIVDDNSVDDTRQIVQRRISGSDNYSLIRAAGSPGKKQAIETGVASSKGELIVTTDADCRVPAEWLRNISGAFASGEIQFLIGGVRISGVGSFGLLQELEFLSVEGVTAATAQLGLPTMCNGANLAYRRSAFEAVGGYEGNREIRSGDDEFLMRKMIRKFKGSVFFLYEPDAVVTTPAQDTVRGFFRQRLRWASKWKFNDSLAAKSLAVWIVVFQASWLLFPVAAATQHFDIQWILALTAVKLIVEFVFLRGVSRFLRGHWSTLHFLILQFVYAPYVIFTGVAALLSRATWK